MSDRRTAVPDLRSPIEADHGHVQPRASAGTSHESLVLFDTEVSAPECLLLTNTGPAPGQGFIVPSVIVIVPEPSKRVKLRAGIAGRTPAAEGRPIRNADL